MAAMQPHPVHDWINRYLQQQKAAIDSIPQGTVARLAPVNAEMNRLLADPAEIDRVLAEGARKARTIAAPIVDTVKDIVGFLRS